MDIINSLNTSCRLRFKSAIGFDSWKKYDLQTKNLITEFCDTFRATANISTDRSGFDKFLLEEFNNKMSEKPIREKLNFLLGNSWKNLVLKVDLSNKNSFEFFKDS